MKIAYEPLQKLSALDTVDGFDCGQAALNLFLQRHALIKQKANSAQTYVCCCKNVVVGYYMAVGSVVHEAAPLRVLSPVRPIHITYFCYSKILKKY